MTGITMDGVTYDVRITYLSLKRNFSFTEGPNADVSKYGTEILDTIGTKYNYTMNVEPNQSNPTAYDDFFIAISSPQRLHEITVPFGQSTLTYKAKILDGGDSYEGKLSGFERWAGLSVSFVAAYPQVMA